MPGSSRALGLVRKLRGRTARELRFRALQRASVWLERAGLSADTRTMNPEFLREGTSIRDFYDPPFTLIGTDDQQAADVVAALYAGLDARVHVTSTGVAEMIKYTCNCFHVRLYRVG